MTDYCSKCLKPNDMMTVINGYMICIECHNKQQRKELEK